MKQSPPSLAFATGGLTATLALALAPEGSLAEASVAGRVEAPQ